MPRHESKNDHSRRDDTMGSAVFNTKDMNSMHQSLNCEFMLYQLVLKRIMNGSNKQKIAANGLCDYFKPDNENDRRTMVEFDDTYKSNTAIHWYTRETCIYRMLNKALRTQNIHHLLGFSSFIRDLYTQLSNEQTTFLSSVKLPLLQVYRGQFISKDEVNRMKSGIGQLFSMNSFLSTSTNKKKALEFATSREPPSDKLTSVLLEIDLYVSASSRPYADIKHLSAYPTEEEILFMFGCVFRIDAVWEDKEKKIWRARLTLCIDDDDDYKAFMATLDKDLRGKDDLVSLGNYLLQLRKFDEAEEHYRTLLDNKLLPTEYDIATCHHGLARVNTEKADYESALDNISIALEYLLKQHNRKCYTLVALCYNDYGSIYCKKGDFVHAFKYYEKALMAKYNNTSITYAGLAEVHVQMGNYNQALECQYKRLEDQSVAPQPFLANIYIDIGKIYGFMGDREQASNMFNEAIKIQTKTLYPGHPDLGYTYTAIGLMYLELDDKKKAFQYINSAFQLQLKSLPDGHPDFWDTYKNFGNLYLKQGDLTKALYYFKKLLHNQVKTLSSNHPSVADTYSLIGKVYLAHNDFKNALVYYKKSLDSQLERKVFGDPSLSKMYRIIADISLKNLDLDEALEYFLKIVENDLERKVLEDQSFAETYRTIGDIYYKKGDFNQALLYYYWLLDCQLQARPFKQSAVIETYTMIGKIYLEKPCDKTLLRFKESTSDKIEVTSSKNASILESHRFIGNIHFEKRHLDQAQHHFKQMLNDQMNKGPHNNHVLIKYLKILGNICIDRHDFDQAFAYSHQLLNIELKTKLSTDTSLMNLYEMIGKIYCEKHDFEKGLAYYNQVLDFQLQMKPLNDTLINGTCTVIGKIYLIKPFHQQLLNFNRLIKNTIVISKFKDVSSEDIPDIIGDMHFQCRHLNRIFSYFEAFLTNKEAKISSRSHLSISKIYKILGNIAIEKRDWNKALFYYRKLLDEKIIEGEPKIHLYKIIATINYEKKNLDEALIYYQKALNDEILEIVIDDPSLSAIHKIMADIHYQKRDLQKALIFYNQLLDCERRIRPTKSSSIHDIYLIIGKIYVEKSFDQSFLNFNHLSDDQVQKKSSILMLIADAHVSIGDIHFEKRHLDQAFDYFHAMYNNQLQTLPPNDSSFRDIYKILANIGIETKDFDKVLTYFHKLLEIELKEKSSEDASLITMYKIMADVYRKRNDFDQALYYINRWIDCEIRQNGTNDSSLADVYNMMGEVYSSEHYRDQTQRCINKLYETESVTLPSASDLNNVFHQANSEKRHLDGAISYFERLLVSKRKTLSKKDPSLIKIHIIIRNMYLNKRDFRQAFIFFQELLDDQLQSKLDKDIVLGSIYEVIAKLYMESGSFRRALTNYRQSLSVYKQIYSPNNRALKRVKREIRKLLISDVEL